MATIQSKLKECIEKQSMNGFEKLQKKLAATEADDEEKLDSCSMDDDSSSTEPINVEAMETTSSSKRELVTPIHNDLRGENKVPIKGKRSRKKQKTYQGKKFEKSQNNANTKPKEQKKPRFFCQF